MWIGPRRAVFSSLPGCTSLHLARTQLGSIILFTKMYLPPFVQDQAGQYSHVYQGVPPSIWPGLSRSVFSCLPGWISLYLARTEQGSIFLFTRVYLPHYGQDPAGQYSVVYKGVPPSIWPGSSRAVVSCLPGCTSLQMARTQQGSSCVNQGVPPQQCQDPAGQYFPVYQGIPPSILPGPCRAVFSCLPGCTSLHMNRTQQGSILLFT